MIILLKSFHIRMILQDRLIVCGLFFIIVDVILCEFSILKFPLVPSCFSHAHTLPSPTPSLVPPFPPHTTRKPPNLKRSLTPRNKTLNSLKHKSRVLLTLVHHQRRTDQRARYPLDLAPVSIPPSNPDHLSNNWSNSGMHCGYVVYECLMRPFLTEFVQ